LSRPALLALPLLVLSSLLPPALLFPLLLPRLPCAIALSANVVSTFVFFVYSASSLLPFVAFPMPS
jgi:hypothetical protein